MLTDVVFEDIWGVGEGTEALLLVVVEVPGQRFAEEILVLMSISVVCRKPCT